MKVEVAVVGSPSLISLMVSVDVKQYRNEKLCRMCESRGGRPGLPVPNKPYVFLFFFCFFVDVKQHRNKKLSCV